MNKKAGLVAVMGEKTNLVKAVSSKDSLRTTLPMFIVRQWTGQAGDQLDWAVDTVKGDTVIVVKINKK